MNTDATLKKLGEGSGSWNAWARELLAERDALRELGAWTEGNRRQDWNVETQTWHDKAKADFTGHTFRKRARFTGFIFPGHSLFEKTRFENGASLNDATFNGPTSFSDAIFGGHCGFTKATFHDTVQFRRCRFTNDVAFNGANFAENVSFEHAVFLGEAHFSSITTQAATTFRYSSFSETGAFNGACFHADLDFRDAAFRRRVSFRETTFGKTVRFDQGTFENTAWFRKSKFNEDAFFRGIRGRGAFALYEATFARVPDFTEAHFDEAPLLDTPGLLPDKPHVPQEKGADLPARWRALRRLAIQGHDHERELQFFKGEIVSRRGRDDRRTHFRYWAGWLYGLLSDFGRSIRRPVFYLLVSVLFFGALYFAIGQWSSSPAAGGPRLCSDQERAEAALGLSVHNAVPFAGVGFSTQRNSMYSCLYGARSNGGAKDARLPDVPLSVAIAGVLQFFCSSILIFLLGLGVRNRFRIK